MKTMRMTLPALVLASAALHGQVPGGSAVNFGMIGLSERQTVRLSIIAYPPNPFSPPEPCIAQLGFANSSGGPVGPTKTINLGPGRDFPR